MRDVIWDKVKSMSNEWDYFGWGVACGVEFGRTGVLKRYWRNQFAKIFWACFWMFDIFYLLYKIIFLWNTHNIWIISNLLQRMFRKQCFRFHDQFYIIYFTFTITFSFSISSDNFYLSASNLLSDEFSYKICNPTISNFVRKA